LRGSVCGTCEGLCSNNTLSPASSHLHTSVSAHLDRPRVHLAQLRLDALLPVSSHLQPSSSHTLTTRVFIPCRPRLHTFTPASPHTLTDRVFIPCSTASARLVARVFTPSTVVSAHLDRPRLHTLSPASSHLHTSFSAHLDRPRLHTLLNRVCMPCRPRLHTFDRRLRTP